jgi:hypothetical protein
VSNGSTCGSLRSTKETGVTYDSPAPCRIRRATVINPLSSRPMDRSAGDGSPVFRRFPAVDTAWTPRAAGLSGAGKRRVSRYPNLSTVPAAVRHTGTPLHPDPAFVLRKVFPVSARAQRRSTDPTRACPEAPVHRTVGVDHRIGHRIEHRIGHRVGHRPFPAISLDRLRIGPGSAQGGRVERAAVGSGAPFAVVGG